MTNRTIFGGKKPSKFYMNKKQVKKMYFNNQLIYQFMNMEVTQQLITANTTIGYVKLNMKEYIKLTNISFDDVTWTIKNIEGTLGSIDNEGILTIPFQTVAVGEVTATYGDISATITVRAEITTIVCTNLTLNTDSISMDMSKELNRNIIANVTPSNTTDEIIWNSSSTSVVTVDSSGRITAKSPGTCRITATCGSKSATCTVTVKASCTELLLGTSVGTLDLSGTNTTTLQVSKTPSNTTDVFSWESSDTNVATVRDGVVTAKAPGTVTITARCGSKSASQTLTVIASCTSMSLSKSSYTLDIGGTSSVTFTPTVTPSNTTDTITWSSSSTSIVSVSATSGGKKGTIFAKSPGTAVVTATCGSKSASVTVTVTASCTGVSLNNYSLSFTTLNATQTLTATLTPSNTTDTVSWGSSNTAVATVNSNGVVTTVGYGSCTITASCGSKNASCTVTVNNPNPYLVLSAKESYMAIGETHTFYADLYNGNIDNLIINLSRPDSYTLTYSKLSSTRVAVTVTMLNDESGAVNFNYNSQLLDRFSIYTRV